jgi:uncharacterized BrkB/YihY/UPF0761 family membrane protein
MDWLLVIGSFALLILALFMALAVNIFQGRQIRRVFREGQPMRWDDPQEWGNSKSKAWRWVPGIVAFVGMGMFLSASFPNADRGWWVFYIAIVTTTVAWIAINRR